MALLGSGEMNLKPLTIISGNPSPTNKRYKRALKGLSLSAVLRKRIGASMTVEAVVALPVFLFFLLNLASLMEMMRLHGNLQLALWNAGNQTALYGSLLENETATALFSGAYIKGRMTSILGREYLEESPLENGAAGMVVWANPLQDEEDILDVTVSYRVAPVSSFMGSPAFYMSNHYYAHLWNGYNVTADEPEAEMVYVTETGTVYHGSRDCTHLSLSVRKVPSGDLGQQRNQWGRTYGACAKCAMGEMPETLCITGEGECYHYDEKCAALKRTVIVLPLTEAQKSYRSCSRCGGKQH